METFENQLEELKEKYWKTVTTKELLAAGFSRYKITQLVKTNVLTRDSRGQYYFTKNDVHARKAFNHFIQSILRYRNYERAYEDLRENIQFQETDQYDNHTILYVKMLEILLGSPSPSSLLEKLHYDESRDEWEN